MRFAGMRSVRCLFPALLSHLLRCILFVGAQRDSSWLMCDTLQLYEIMRHLQHSQQIADSQQPLDLPHKTVKMYLQYIELAGIHSLFYCEYTLT